LPDDLAQLTRFDEIVRHHSLAKELLVHFWRLYCTFSSSPTQDETLKRITEQLKIQHTQLKGLCKEDGGEEGKRLVGSFLKQIEHALESGRKGTKRIKIS
jgi:hypothetical protein